MAVSYKQKHVDKVMVHSIVELALKIVVKWTDGLDNTIAIDCDIKTKQTKALGKPHDATLWSAEHFLSHPDAGLIFKGSKRSRVLPVDRLAWV